MAPAFTPTLVAALDRSTKNVEVTRAELLSYAGDNQTKTIDGIAASDVAWYQPQIDTTRWNKQFPYQLLVIEAIKEADGTRYRPYSDFRYTLPVPPEAMAYGMPFANRVSATLEGVVEERNGAPFRTITIRSTTGLLPGRGSPLADPGGLLSPTIFGGTLQAVTNTADAIRDTINSAKGSGAVAYNVHSLEEIAKTDDKTNLVGRTSGYYQIHLLKRFLEAYATLSKSEAGSKFRLALAVWKEQEVYLVTPLSFSIDRSATSPLEYPYTISFQAWKRIALGGSNQGFAVTPQVRRTPNGMARIVNTLRNARKVLQGSTQVLRAITADVHKLIFEPLREGILLASDAAQLTRTAADLPDDIKRAMESAWIESQSLLRSSDQSTRTQQQNDGLLGDAKQQTGVRAFREPSRFAPFFETIDPAVLKLRPAVWHQIEAETKRVRELTKNDLSERRQGLKRSLDELLVAVGASDDTYNLTYGIVAPQRKTEPTESDWAAIDALESALEAYTALAADSDLKKPALEARLDTFAEIYNAAGIPFRVPNSKFAVPVPYGLSMEAIAQRYLGDPSRAPEIIHLNGLRYPYIDEVGFELALVAPTEKNSAVVGPQESLEVGQSVWLQSRTKRRQKVRITSLRSLGGQTYLELDQDVGGFRPQEGATLESFKRYTTNSQQLIYIPSEADPQQNPWVTSSIPGVDEYDKMLAVGGVDLLLDSNQDVILTPDGDTRWAQGLTNILQHLGILVQLPQGDLMGHPTTGIGIQVGSSVADLDPQKYVEAVQKMLAQDPSFSKVDAVQLVRSGVTAKVNIGATIAGTSQAVAVGYDVG